MAFFRQKTRVVSAIAAYIAIVSIANAQAQVQAQTAAESTLKPVTVNDRTAAPQADVTGFGDAPLARTPISANVIGSQQMDAIGARRLADLIKLDASISDAYNTVGYWDYATVRGFVLDNKRNFRREGMPISAETFIPLENKERVEVLKGTSGIQAGTSAPGGLVNFAVKRPPQEDLRSVRAETSSLGGLLLATDLGGRFGVDKQVGWRLNAAAEDIKSYAPATNGKRQLLALAMDLRISKDSVLEAEIEYSRRSQPSLPGLSLLGNALPAPDPKLNPANQPWALPVVLEGVTGSLRFEQALNSNWRWSAQAATQRLKSDDRSAFPFGCSTDPSGNYVADRYCANGDFDLYDFRSENERRTTNALQFQLKGKVETGGIKHDLSFGVLSSRTTELYELQAYNYVGTGNLGNLQNFAAAPATLDQNTNRTERSTELSAFDAIAWTPAFSTWLGLRSTALQRDSIRTDGSRATSYAASVATPWLAASYQLDPSKMVYASWGQGIESQVVPNRPAQYTNAGVALPSLKSSQWELGIKGGNSAKDGNAALGWQLAYFNIVRPMSNLDACNRLGITPCLGAYDGEAVHRGLEASAQWVQGPWTANGGLTLINARRQGSVAEPTTNGMRPTNVPNWIARAQAGYRVAAVPGLQVTAGFSHEGARAVLPDQSVMLPAWTRIDAGLRYDTMLSGYKTSWTVGIDNLLDRRFFRESPYQFGHVYLFPAAPRTLRFAVQASL